MKTMLVAALLLAASAAMADPAPLDFQLDVPTGGAPQQVVFVEHDFAKGESTGLHIHHGVEMTFVMKGTMRVSIQGQAPFVVQAGGSFRVEREVPHDAMNVGDGKASLIITYVVDQGRPLKEPYAPPP
jgi:quercetin dioxygenase-like cupin family protein